ncbi:LPS translocon maturation chaperone LptM [Chromatocurvus halotolerans]|uniref:Putative lipoprotein n=1 Tax=Chromatocurvus halotolerans TaxID=1132028 RepID=A0A4R2KTV4_9GAMM|nr:lipoprotein [Chromatocurvus halotolerans]TCO77223.1 putative lipoprotein [Chromatocurvus halotolerans]
MFRTLLFVACVALASCGQTGPLYPQPEPETLAGIERVGNLQRLP